MDWEYSQDGCSKTCTQNVDGETYSVMAIWIKFCQDCVGWALILATLNNQILLLESVSISVLTAVKISVGYEGYIVRRSNQAAAGEAGC